MLKKSQKRHVSYLFIRMIGLSGIQINGGCDPAGRVENSKSC